MFQSMSRRPFTVRSAVEISVKKKKLNPVIISECVASEHVLQFI